MKQHTTIFFLGLLCCVLLVFSYWATQRIQLAQAQVNHASALVEGHNVVFKHKSTNNQTTTLHAVTCVYNENKNSAVLKNISLLSKKNGTILLKLKATEAMYKTNTKEATLYGPLEGLVFGGTIRLEDAQYAEKAGIISSDKKITFTYDTFSVTAARGAYVLDNHELTLHDVETMYELQSSTTNER